MQNNNSFSNRKTVLSAALFIAFNSVSVSVMAQISQGEPVAQKNQQVSAEQVTTMYQQGDYRSAAKLGNEYLRRDPHNAQLRYMVANSYAWTGQYPEAIEHYQALQGTKMAAKANIGLANVYRWSGIPGRAVPLYNQALSAEPGNKDAAEGLAYAMRELRSRTQVRVTIANDSLDTNRTAITVAQRWTDQSLQHSFELEVGALEDERDALEVEQRDLALRYAGVASVLKPRFEISLQQQPENEVFANGEIMIPNTPVIVSAGRVNWGKMVFDPNALQANLTANQFGLNGALPTEIGMWRASYRYCDVSDDNTIQDANLQYMPTWQPLQAQKIKFFVGFDAREARFNSPAYWSPSDGHYLGTVGVSGEWVDRSWEKNVLLQYGFPLGGEAEHSYSASAGIKHWATENLAVGFNVFAQKSQRSGAYRANTAMFTVQGIW